MPRNLGVGAPPEAFVPPAMIFSRKTKTARPMDAKVVLSGTMRICDAAVVVGAGLGAYFLRHGSLNLASHYLLAIVVATLLTANALHVARLYDQRNLGNVQMQLGTLTGAWLVVVLLLITLAFFSKTSDSFSRSWAVMWFAASLGGFILLRAAMMWQLGQWQRAGRLATRIAILGEGETAEALCRHIASQEAASTALAGVFAADRAGLDALSALTQSGQVDEIVLALPWGDDGRLAEALRGLRTLSVNVRLAPEVIDPPVPPRGFSTLAGVPMLNVYERPLSGWSLVLKAIEDRLLGALILLLVLPLMALTALAIHLDSPGPALFRQRRYGFNNNEFTVFKFRTMTIGPESGDAVSQARREDPRVTRVGAFLRRTSLDELPQLFNVLRGEMSLVGPRPHAVLHNKQYAEIIDGYLGRHRVKPGITGWAQVNGLRGETDTPDKMHQRVEHDLYYIDHWSLLFDLRILFLTFFVGFVNRNAY
jgi:Undecaprenyl-phosphate glucose phosphotransferase